MCNLGWKKKENFAWALLTLSAVCMARELRICRVKSFLICKLKALGEKIEILVLLWPRSVLSKVWCNGLINFPLLLHWFGRAFRVMKCLSSIEDLGTLVRLRCCMGKFPFALQRWVLVLRLGAVWPFCCLFPSSCWANHFFLQVLLSSFPQLLCQESCYFKWLIALAGAQLMEVSLCHLMIWGWVQKAHFKKPRFVK